MGTRAFFASLPRIHSRSRQNGQTDRGGYLKSFEAPPLEPVLVTDARGHDISLETLDKSLQVAQAVLDKKGGMQAMPVASSV
jgi:hypothetical protein